MTAVIALSLGKVVMSVDGLVNKVEKLEAKIENRDERINTIDQKLALQTAKVDRIQSDVLDLQKSVRFAPR
ncbi:hypothetical protein D9M68_966380 [compost metagenome]